MTTRGSFVPSYILAIWLMLASLQGAAAQHTKRATKKLICNTDSNGVQRCTEKISPAVIAAIVVTTVGVILLAIGVWFFIHRARSRREENVEDQLQVEASQMQGPPPIIGVNAIPSSRKRGKKHQNTTYAANYDPSSAPVLPHLAHTVGHGSAPVLSMSMAHGPPSAPITRLQGSAYGYGPNSAGPYGTPPQTAPNGKGFGHGKSPYPFVGISSSQLPPMPQAGPSYASGGYVGNRF